MLYSAHRFSARGREVHDHRDGAHGDDRRHSGHGNAHVNERDRGRDCGLSHLCGYVDGCDGDDVRGRLSYFLLFSSLTP